jgi:hypothetical protein
LAGGLPCKVPGCFSASSWGKHFAALPFGRGSVQTTQIFLLNLLCYWPLLAFFFLLLFLLLQEEKEGGDGGSPD